MSLLDVIYYEGINLFHYYGFQSLEIWTFDIACILFLMNIYFPKTIYNHQAYSMLFVIIFNTILLIIASFIKDSNDKNIYEKEGFKCIFIIIIFLIITIFISFSRIQFKILIDKKFISPYLIIFLIGIFGLILNIFFCLYINLTKNEKDYIYNYGNIFDYFSGFKDININKIFLEIILTISYIFFHFMSIMCELFIIKFLNPNYILISDNIFAEIVKIFNIITGKNSLLKTIIIEQATEVLEFIGCSIYLEIIELRFCGLNTNVKKNIIERSKSESMDYNDVEEIYDDDKDKIELIDKH